MGQVADAQLRDAVERRQDCATGLVGEHAEKRGNGGHVRELTLELRDELGVVAEEFANVIHHPRSRALLPHPFVHGSLTSIAIKVLLPIRFDHAAWAAAGRGTAAS